MSIAAGDIERLDSVATSTTGGNYLEDRTARRYAVVAVLLLLAYFIGFTPAWLMANRYEGQLNDLQRRSQIDAVRLALADAALSADRGDYEDARQASIDFFTRLRAELGRQDSALSTDHRRHFQEILEQRDELIGQLARGDESGSRILSKWYFELEGPN
jgi:hypothetical protein